MEETKHEEKRFCSFSDERGRRYPICTRNVYGIIPEWNAMKQGIVIGIIGIAILIAMVLVRRVMDGKPAIVLNAKAIGTTLLGVVGAIVLGVGMCMTMIWGMLVQGIVVGIIGIVLLLCLIPAIAGLK
jgi:hypothetical protein